MQQMNLDVEMAQGFLTERYQIANMQNATGADWTYFRGALAMIQALGLDYVVNDGHITILEGVNDGN